MSSEPGRARLTVIVAIIAVILAGAGGLWLAARNALQFRAYYPGDLVFVGYAHGLFDTRYHRLFMWKAPNYQDALPDLSFHIEGRTYRLDELTENTVNALGGQLPAGGIYDEKGNILGYRFEGGRLTWVSLTSEFRPPNPDLVGKPGSNVHPGEFYVSIGASPPFRLPVTYRQLVAWGCPPQTTGRSIPN